MSGPDREAPDFVGETVVLDETRVGPFQIRAKAGSATFIIDEPIGSGGMGSGPNPYDLLSAAIGACTLMTLRMFATRKRMPLDTVRVRVTHHRRGLDGADSFVREILLTGDLSEDDRAKLAEISLKCPVHKTISKGSTINTLLVANHDFVDEAITRNAHHRDMVMACDT